MRDNHEGMIEFIDAFQKDEHYFVIIELESRRFQFGVSVRGYRAVKHVMQLRPFDAMPGLKYRHFYAGSSKRLGTDDYCMYVRSELGRKGTTNQLGLPKDLHANLLWFMRLENINEAAYLKIECEVLGKDVKD